ncbi:hypothetical protein F8388_013988 [Cannabis sativa]|nr:hypothetical protein F8388_013988 [Cannabis sativa]
MLELSRMHGVLRLIVTLDGEDVIDCEPILGYLHRGMEKIAENRTIIQYLPYVTRWDYLATMFTEAITVNGPELLGNIQNELAYLKKALFFGRSISCLVLHGSTLQELRIILLKPILFIINDQLASK